MGSRDYMIVRLPEGALFMLWWEFITCVDCTDLDYGYNNDIPCYNSTCVTLCHDPTIYYLLLLIEFPLLYISCSILLYYICWALQLILSLYIILGAGKAKDEKGPSWA